MATRIWDMLRVGIRPKGGGTVTFTFQHEEISQGMELTSLRNINPDSPYWPKITVVTLDEYSIILGIGYDGDNMELFSLDMENMEVNLKVGTLESPAILMLELVSFTLKIEEFDEFEGKTVYFYVDDEDWDNALNGDHEAALSIANAIAEQRPESLEIIARYMERAARLGNKDAYDWLAEYYHGDDGRYDAYC